MTDREPRVDSHISRRKPHPIWISNREISHASFDFPSSHIVSFSRFRLSSRCVEPELSGVKVSWLLVCKNGQFRKNSRAPKKRQLTDTGVVKRHCGSQYTDTASFHNSCVKHGRPRSAAEPLERRSVISCQRKVFALLASSPESPESRANFSAASEPAWRPTDSIVASQHRFPLFAKLAVRSKKV